LAWEIFGNRALRQGDWKIRWEFKPLGTGAWESLQRRARRRRTPQRGRRESGKGRELLALWEQYVRDNNVLIPTARCSKRSYDQAAGSRSRNDPGYPPLIYKRQFVPPKDMTAARALTIAVFENQQSGRTLSHEEPRNLKSAHPVCGRRRALLAISALCASQAQAQVPGRFYWKTLSDSSAVPLIVESISGRHQSLRSFASW